ncbi:MAG: CNP1-like family protein [Sedimenticola sp.]|nr:CNP1-like family protein [Sedimenticola sp.]
MIRIHRMVCLLALPALLLAGVLQAAENNSPINASKGDANFYNPHDSVNPNVEEYVWEEQETGLPPYPEDDNLIEFQVTRPNAAFRYYIDADSLSYNPKDGIVRYTVVIRSQRGASNVAFEGMRCTTSEYKTYAFGNGKGELVQPRRKPEWKPILKDSYTRYRNDLYDFYFCNIHVLDLSRDKIIAELKYRRPEVLESGFH